MVDMCGCIDIGTNYICTLTKYHIDIDFSTYVTVLVWAAFMVHSPSQQLRSAPSRNHNQIISMRRKTSIPVHRKRALDMGKY